VAREGSALSNRRHLPRERLTAGSREILREGASPDGRDAGGGSGRIAPSTWSVTRACRAEAMAKADASDETRPGANV